MKKSFIRGFIGFVCAVSVLSAPLSARAATPLTSANFNSARYADTYPDLKNAFDYDAAALWNHYVNYGAAEGRIAYTISGDVGVYTGPVSSTAFDHVTYANNYPDLLAAYGYDAAALYNHYMNFGIRENRVLTPLAQQSQAVKNQAKQIVNKNPLPASFQLPVAYLPQYPELPTGCEAVALTTALNYLGYPVSKVDIAANYMPKGAPGRVNPDYAFPGNPFSSAGYGCFAPCIVQTANNYFAVNNIKNQVAVNVSGLDVATLCSEYLYKYNRPVIFWASMYMVNITAGPTWNVDGVLCTWRNNSHCLALIGWTPDAYIFSDPLRGIIAYDRALIENIYQQNQRNAVFIMPQ